MCVGGERCALAAKCVMVPDVVWLYLSVAKDEGASDVTLKPSFFAVSVLLDSYHVDLCG